MKKAHSAGFSYLALYCDVRISSMDRLANEGEAAYHFLSHFLIEAIQGVHETVVECGNMPVEVSFELIHLILKLIAECCCGPFRTIKFGVNNGQVLS